MKIGFDTAENKTVHYNYSAYSLQMQFLDSLDQAFYSVAQVRARPGRAAVEARCAAKMARPLSSSAEVRLLPLHFHGERLLGRACEVERHSKLIANYRIRAAVT